MYTMDCLHLKAPTMGKLVISGGIHKNSLQDGALALINIQTRSKHLWTIAFNKLGSWDKVLICFYLFLFIFFFCSFIFFPIHSIRFHSNFLLFSFFYSFLYVFVFVFILGRSWHVVHEGDWVIDEDMFVLCTQTGLYNIKFFQLFIKTDPNRFAACALGLGRVWKNIWFFCLLCDFKCWDCWPRVLCSTSFFVSFCAIEVALVWGFI